MNTTRIMGLIQTKTVSFLLATVVVLILGVMTTNGATAKEFSKPAYTSIKTRTQAQSDLCFVGGGTTSVSTSNGSTTTTCEGGKQDGMECVNTERMTSCDMPQTWGLGDSLLGAVIVDSVAIAPEPATSPEDPYVDVVPVSDPAVAPEPISTPEGEDKGIDPGVVSEEAPEVAPEPTATPEDAGPVIDNGAVIEEAPAVNPGTEGEATSTGKGPFVEVVVGDSGALLAPVDEEQQ
jgi:hypothetical protein